MSSVNYALEHFYYGQLTRDGKPEGDLQLLAQSPGVGADQIAEAIKVALLPPLFIAIVLQRYMAIGLTIGGVKG